MILAKARIGRPTPNMLLRVELNCHISEMTSTILWKMTWVFDAPPGRCDPMVTSRMPVSIPQCDPERSNLPLNISLDWYVVNWCNFHHKKGQLQTTVLPYYRSNITRLSGSTQWIPAFSPRRCHEQATCQFRRPSWQNPSEITRTPRGPKMSQRSVNPRGFCSNARKFRDRITGDQQMFVGYCQPNLEHENNRDMGSYSSTMQK